jgi:hypothetical protein
MPAKASKAARSRGRSGSVSSSSAGTASTVAPASAAAPPTTVDALPDELLLHIFTHVKGVTLITSVPGVCRRWRSLCGDTPAVRLDLGFLGRRAPLTLHNGDATGARMVLAMTRRWKHIVEVELGCETSSDVILTALAPFCPQLTEICTDELEVNAEGHITDTSVTTLAMHCPLLTTVALSMCAITDMGVTILVEQCKHLTSLSFPNCKFLSSRGLLEIAKHGAGLTEIDLSSCELMDDEDHGLAAVIALAKGCPRLTTIRMAVCSLTDESVSAFAQNCPLLSVVHIRDNDEVTDAGVCALAERCAKLTDVDFCMCSALTREAVMALANKCPLLSVIDFSFCHLVDDEAVLSLVITMRLHLRHVNFSYCTGITSGAAVALAFYVPRNCPQLSLLNLSGLGPEPAVALHVLQNIFFGRLVLIF